MDPQPVSYGGPISKNLQSLIEWGTNLGGGLHKGVELFNDASKGQYLRVKPDWTGTTTTIPSGTCVAKCPIKATMSTLNLIQGVEGLPEHDFSCPADFLALVEPEGALAFFLMHERIRGEESFWAPYIRSLPEMEQLTTTQYYEGEDLEWLRGTNLFNAREMRLELWQLKYDQGVRALKGLGVPAADSYSWDLFLWAATICTSRAFSSKVLTGFEGQSALEGRESPVLLPLVDLSNHQPLAKVEWQAAKDAVNLVVLEDSSPGQEIHNNYGPRSNDQLMVSYGFCIPGNVCDYRTVALNAPPDTPLYEAKRVQEAEYPSPENEPREFGYYVFNIFNPFVADESTTERSVFSRDLFDATSIMAANDRELQSLQVEKERIYIPSEEYGNSRCVLAALGQIAVELISHLARNRVGGFLDKEPQSQKQRHAKFYREGQRMISEHALTVTGWMLSRAKEINLETTPATSIRRLDDYLSRLPPERSDETTIKRLKSLIEDRESIVKYDGELFKDDKILSVLPPRIRQSCHSFLNDVMYEAKNIFGNSGMPMEATFLRYAIFLCICAAAYRHLHAGQQQLEGPQTGHTDSLPPRVKRWIEILLENNPAPPTDEGWVFPDDDDEMLLVNFDALVENIRSSDRKVFDDMKQFTGPWNEDEPWLSGNWLRWSWLIVQDEVIQLVRDPLRFVTDEEYQVGPTQLSAYLKSEPYLYIPQLPSDILHVLRSSTKPGSCDYL
ncbi:hypothetical protein AJ80_09255 [Polytolypa hystricis UAMH7299]|uniref:SET domain-containing protein n=1 Tax=Polytolypa hystricis (strain UAMH7299) TaxID=1447883 RepID=A0A2B7WTQ2_POLH7|nr:hypothetical protein AJ80_09255 [Polytolypa hystricis UAMH7299]